MHAEEKRKLEKALKAAEAGNRRFAEIVGRKAPPKSPKTTVAVKRVFESSKLGQIAGCYVEKGKLKYGDVVEVWRARHLDAPVRVHTGKLKELRRFKHDVVEVSEGFECGVKLEGFELRVGDVIAVGA